MTAPSRRILVTGASGNLGRKLIAGFLRRPWCGGIVGVDRAPAPDASPPDPRLEFVAADLTDPAGAWREAVSQADAIVHLAARNPYPDASWAEAVASFDMTVNLVEAAAASGARRFVMASSNHVMGGYKETSVARSPGVLTTDLPPWPGTRSGGADTVPSPAYAVAKLMAERLCAGTAACSGLTAVSLRIGWCQPGDNDPATISASGTPKQDRAAEAEEARDDLFWFRSMWLSNGDCLRVVEAAILADAACWPAPAIVVNAMSDNRAMPWDLGPTRRLIGYEPEDDIWRSLAEVGGGLDPGP